MIHTVKSFSIANEVEVDFFWNSLAFSMIQQMLTILSLLDSEGEEEGGMIWENGIETCIISYMKRITSPGSMHDNGCLGLIH